MAIQIVGLMPPMAITTDNTSQPLLNSDDLPPSSLCILEAKILGKGANDSSVCAVWIRYAFQRDGTGNAVFRGDLYSPQVDNVSGNWFADADVSGANPRGIYIFVNGAAATTVYWWGEMTITAMQIPA